MRLGMGVLVLPHAIVMRCVEDVQLPRDHRERDGVLATPSGNARGHAKLRGMRDQVEVGQHCAQRVMTTTDQPRVTVGREPFGPGDEGAVHGRVLA